MFRDDKEVDLESGIPDEISWQRNFGQSQINVATFSQLAPDEPPAIELNQITLLKKIDIYRARNGLERISIAGHCHGLSLLWLKRMAESREEEMYQAIYRICRCPDEDLHQLSSLIDKLFKSADKKQNPLDYSSNKIDYKNVSMILKASEQTNLDCLYTIASLANLFSIHKQKGNMFCITTGWSYSARRGGGKHSIGVFVRGDEYFIYDSNYASGRAKIFTATNLLAAEVWACLYTEFKFRAPSQISLEIKLVRVADLKKQHSDRVAIDIGREQPQESTSIMYSLWSRMSYYTAWWYAQEQRPQLASSSKKRKEPYSDEETRDTHAVKRREL